MAAVTQFHTNHVRIRQLQLSTTGDWPPETAATTSDAVASHATPVKSNTASALDATVAATPTAADEPISLDGLLEAWGRGESSYDFNDDGFVGMQDLIMLLTKLSGGEQEGKERNAARTPARLCGWAVLHDV